MLRIHTDCGLTLALDHDVLLPLTPCCGVASDSGAHVTRCTRCWRSVPVGYGYAAYVGHDDFRRDLRNILDWTTKCPDPATCIAETCEEVEHA